MAGVDDEMGPTERPRDWEDRHDTTTIVYNPRVPISGIPEAAERYTLGSRSALAWGPFDRWQVKTDPASGIVNDPNGSCAPSADLVCDMHRIVEHPRPV